MSTRLQDASDEPWSGNAELGPPLERGNMTRAVNELFLLTYQELRRIARARLRRNETITLLDTTSLVHECYLRFLNARRIEVNDRAHFIGYAANAMRSIIVDFIRRRRAARRGAGADHEQLDEALVGASTEEIEVLRINEALEDLAKVEPRLVQVVELRYFGGLTETEIAGLLNVTERTVRRDWEKARRLLFAAVSGT